MHTQFNGSIEKSNLIFLNAPIGLIEITLSGEILNMNKSGNIFLSQLQQAYCCKSVHIYDVLNQIDTRIAEQIHHFQSLSGLIFIKDIVFNLSQQENTAEKCFKITVSKVMDDCFIVALEDNTEKHRQEKAMQQSELEKAIAQGKYEIASEVLHDIGNAVVGFGTYLNRVNRLLDKQKGDSLNNVSLFINYMQQQLETALGADKAKALATLLEGIAKSERAYKEELRKAVDEQLGIISHIQEILTIQRQYVVGHEAQGRKAVKLKQVIDDCISMSCVAFDKKNIQVNLYADGNNMPVIKGDRTKLMQVILNLLKNSMEAIDAEATEKKIDIQLEGNENTIDLKIKDSGKGFEAGSAIHFFQRGFTTKHTGTGLGLYNCKQIIEAHAGTIQMNSDGLGKGAVTHIRFQQ
ncbi:HAMP domain-containing histidine kinase [Ilyomonas limi]|uniref:histidine kinase n=1 Tax=Ilyomonas limi TaxID=2575867 RepID=A0A4U3KTA1_9BACT|nr:HAMP domain-containing sensor histidine kinase [Ilyomonas limi]TKK64724.1 HAMP domain-containing histidine kinase [Ilyomonas limi]